MKDVKFVYDVEDEYVSASNTHHSWTRESREQAAMQYQKMKLSVKKI